MKISNLSKNYNAKKVVNSVNLEIKKNKGYLLHWS